MSEEIDLHQTMDADVWAKEFCRLNICSDVDMMRAWFANAIMCGYDHANWKHAKEQPSQPFRIELGEI